MIHDFKNLTAEDFQEVCAPLARAHAINGEELDGAAAALLIGAQEDPAED